MGSRRGGRSILPLGERSEREQDGGDEKGREKDGNGKWKGWERVGGEEVMGTE